MATPMGSETEQVDVLICGSGSAGLCAAVWLSRYNVNYKVLERRAGPLQIGQADGVQTRTVEIFDSFGIAEPLLKEAYHVLEIAFWSPDEGDESIGIKRKRYAADKETGISHQPHVILNQAKLNELMIGELDDREKRIGYEVEVKGVVVEEEEGEFPVRVDVVERGSERVYRAKYALVSIFCVSVCGEGLLMRIGMRRRAFGGAKIARVQDGRRHVGFRLGRHGHLPEDRVPRHSQKVRHQLGGGQHPHHPSRGRLARALLH
jgi:hypothetical protein